MFDSITPLYYKIIKSQEKGLKGYKREINLQILFHYVFAKIGKKSLFNIKSKPLANKITFFGLVFYFFVT